MKTRWEPLKNFTLRLGTLMNKDQLWNFFKRLFWHNKIELACNVMKECKQCKLNKLIKSLQFGIKDMKNILIYDFFYYVTFDIVSFLLKTNGDKYVLVVIGHHLMV